MSILGLIHISDMSEKYEPAPKAVSETEHVHYDKKNRIFRLSAGSSTYAFRIASNLSLEHLYFGKTLACESDLKKLSVEQIPKEFYNIVQEVNDLERSAPSIKVESLAEQTDLSNTAADGKRRNESFVNAPPHGRFVRFENESLSEYRRRMFALSYRNPSLVGNSLERGKHLHLPRNIKRLTTRMQRGFTDDSVSGDIIKDLAQANNDRKEQDPSDSSNESGVEVIKGYRERSSSGPKRTDENKNKANTNEIPTNAIEKRIQNSSSDSDYSRSDLRVKGSTNFSNVYDSVGWDSDMNIKRTRKFNHDGGSTKDLVPEDSNGFDSDSLNLVVQTKVTLPLDEDIVPSSIQDSGSASASADRCNTQNGFTDKFVPEPHCEKSCQQHQSLKVDKASYLDSAVNVESMSKATESKDPKLTVQAGICLEYSCAGIGDFRSPSFSFVDDYDGSSSATLRYKRHYIYSDKLPMPDNLPGIYTCKRHEATTLVVVMSDDSCGLEVHLIYVCMHDYDIITRRAVFLNVDKRQKVVSVNKENASNSVDDEKSAESHGQLDGTYMTQNSGRVSMKGSYCKVLSKACSLSLDLAPRTAPWHMTTLSHFDPTDCKMVTMGLTSGLHGIGSRKNITGHDFTPFTVLSIGPPAESGCEVIGFCLVYSGSFLMEAEVQSLNRLRVNIGIHPDTLRWHLGRGEVFNTPEVVLGHSSQGLGGLSKMFHRICRERLEPKTWASMTNPVVLCTEAALVHRFNSEGFLNIAKQMVDLGVDVMVLDIDPLLKHYSVEDMKSSSITSLFEILPEGFDTLVRRINAVGVKIGLQLKLESIICAFSTGMDDLHLWLCEMESHKSLPTSRILDFSQTQVVDYVFEILCKLFQSANFEYIHWDINYLNEPEGNCMEVHYMTQYVEKAVDARHESPQDSTHANSCSRKASNVCKSNTTGTSNLRPAVYPSETMHWWILGMYRLQQKLASAFPQISFNAKAFISTLNFSMISIFPTVWQDSDEYGWMSLCSYYDKSVFYPTRASSLIHKQHTYGSTSNNILLSLRERFGFSLDSLHLTEEQFEQFRYQIFLYKKLKHIFLLGDMYRLWDPKGSYLCAFEFVSRDKKEALVFCFSCGPAISILLPRLHLRGLLTSSSYEVVELQPLRNRPAEGSVGIREMNNLSRLKMQHGPIAVFSGETLANAGLLLDFDSPSESIVIYLRSL